MITNVRLAGGLDPRTITLLIASYPDYWDDLPFDTGPAAESTPAVNEAEAKTA